MENKICVSHEAECNVRDLPDLGDHLKNLICCGACLEGSDIGVLDDRTFRNGIRERNADFYDVSSGFSHFEDEFVG